MPLRGMGRAISIPGVPLRSTTGYSHLAARGTGSVGARCNNRGASNCSRRLHGNRFAAKRTTESRGSCVAHGRRKGVRNRFGEALMITVWKEATCRVSSHSADRALRACALLRKQVRVLRLCIVRGARGGYPALCGCRCPGDNTPRRRNGASESGYDLPGRGHALASGRVSR